MPPAVPLDVRLRLLNATDEVRFALPTAILITLYFMVLTWAHQSIDDICGGQAERDERREAPWPFLTNSVARRWAGVVSGSA